MTTEKHGAQFSNHIGRCPEELSTAPINLVILQVTGDSTTNRGFNNNKINKRTHNESMTWTLLNGFFFFSCHPSMSTCFQSPHETLSHETWNLFRLDIFLQFWSNFWRKPKLSLGFLRIEQLRRASFFPLFNIILTSQLLSCSVHFVGFLALEGCTTKIRNVHDERFFLSSLLFQVLFFLLFHADAD